MTTIEIGGFYKDAHGAKVEVLKIFQRKNEACVAAIYDMHDGYPAASWDRVEEAQQHWTSWVDEPSIPWDSVPQWLEWWAMDDDGTQTVFENKPVIYGDREWLAREGAYMIPPKHLHIPYTGDWRESLRQRPGKEGK